MLRVRTPSSKNVQVLASLSVVVLEEEDGICSHAGKVLVDIGHRQHQVHHDTHQQDNDRIDDAVEQRAP